MRKYLIILFFFLSLAGNSQVELAIQKGHSGEIMLMEFSPKGTFLASQADNNEVVIWDMNHFKILSTFKINDLEEIKGMRFSEDEKELLVRTIGHTYFFEILTSEIKVLVLEADTLYREKDYFLDTEKSYETWIVDGAIKKKRRDKRLKKYKLSVTYLNAPFNAFDVSLDKNMIVGVAADEMIYVYNYTSGLKMKVLKGHNSTINDVRFSPDGKYFATAGKDRSIIIWDTRTLEMKTRLATKVFQKNTAIFSEDGNRIYVGDELGYIYEIDLGLVFPKVNVSHHNFHAVNKIKRFRKGDKMGYYIATSDNYIFYKENLAAEEPLAKYALMDHRVLRSKKIILQKAFNVYQEPFGEVTGFDVSPDGKRIAYVGKSDIPNVALASTINQKTRHFYNEGSWEQWTDIGFTSDSTFISTLDSSNILYKWMIGGKRGKDYFLQTDTLPFVIANFEYIGNNRLWLNAVDYGQFMYDLESRLLDKKLDVSADDLFRFGKYLIVGTRQNQILFYDTESDKIYHKFSGHADKITDVNFHPDGDMFVSSSEDGTIKLWSLSRKEMIVTVIPFRDQEFVFVMEDNTYLISKGAMDEIGFKHEGEFFFPDQFDLKFNRPDVVLDKLGFTDEGLIEAYHKAYLKRLKKMNFTEDQLSGDFHLPDIGISNLSTIPLETEDNFLKLDVLATDSKYNLDRINVWVNDVAVKEINLRERSTGEFSDRISVDLAYGKNKIEVSALNQNGAESYKKTVVIESSAGKKKPDLYLVAVGVSDYKESKYNLNFAAKDALNICSTFQLSPYFNQVFTKSLTDKEATIENLEELKPFLAKADINDVVMVFVAGHGVLDENFDYYFASHDIDFTSPAERGIPYEEIENLVDKIKALRKLLFLDTCHSGELDKDDVEADTVSTNVEDGELIFRSVGTNVKYKDTPFGLQSTNELMKSLFTDLRRGTGATVISSSGGAELSIEGGNFKNGLFTYCLINGLTNREADLNKDKMIMVSELQIYIRDEVQRLSNGAQTPTSRIQNNELDYRLW